jgi:hypothetical protein
MDLCFAVFDCKEHKQKKMTPVHDSQHLLQLNFQFKCCLPIEVLTLTTAIEHRNMYADNLEERSYIL